MSTTITIDPVSRIEGHSKITIHLDEQGNVAEARFHVTEFRGFEAFCVGRPFWEMPGITARICGICPVSHILASAKAGDALLSVTLPPTAIQLRRLMNLAQIVQSHALSFFHLSSPDLLLGFDSDPTQRNIFGLIAADPSFARSGIQLRQFGQEIIELLGGRKIHPAWAVPGGVRAGITKNQAQAISDQLPAKLEAVQTALARFYTNLEQFQAEIASFGTQPTAFAGLAGPHGQWEHYAGSLRIMASDGALLADIAPADYRSAIAESVENWTYLKFPYLRALGYPTGSYRVGPLARLNLCTQIGTPLADRHLTEFRQRAGHPAQSAFWYHAARLIEMIAALEAIGHTLADEQTFGSRLRADAGINQLVGVGVSEAPRGTLFHEYEVDHHGLIKRVNLLIATGQNNLAINQAVTQVAQRWIHGPNIPEGMLNRVEASVRAFDPCLSCSTHANGHLRLLVELYAADCTLLDRVLQ
jgi:NAD-reducing hydrogenase large subunit